MRVAITGSDGFLGRWVVKAFKEAKHEVVGIDLDGADQNFDLTDRESALKALDYSKPEAVIQLAAMAGATGRGGGAESLKEPWRFIDHNVRIVNNVMEACRILKIPKVINMSSFSIYGNAPCPIDEDTPLNPLNPYGTSKVCIEEIIKAYSRYGIKVVNFRVPLICGEGQTELNALREFVKCAVEGKPLEVWGDGSTLREFVHPSDVARAYLQALNRMDDLMTPYPISEPYECFVLGNEPIRMDDLASECRFFDGSQIQYLKDKPQLFDQFTDHSKASKILGWEPEISVYEIIERVVMEMDIA